MKQIFACFLFFYIFLNAYGKDESVIPIIKENLFNDETFIRYTKQAKKIYIWNIQEEISLQDKIKKQKKIRDVLECDDYETICIQNSIYKFDFNELVKGKKSDKIWDRMCFERQSPRKIVILKLSDIYQCSEYKSYCLIQVYLANFCCRYEYILIKKDTGWIISKKEKIVDFII